MRSFRNRATRTKKSAAPKARGIRRDVTRRCYTCKIRRKKCDSPNEEGECDTCVRLHLECLAERPEWLKDNRNVLDVREKIMQFLAGQAKIGHGAGNSDKELPKLFLSEMHATLTVSPERDDPPPSSSSHINYSSRDQLFCNDERSDDVGTTTSDVADDDEGKAPTREPGLHTFAMEQSLMPFTRRAQSHISWPANARPKVYKNLLAVLIDELSAHTFDPRPWKDLQKASQHIVDHDLVLSLVDSQRYRDQLLEISSNWRICEQQKILEALFDDVQEISNTLHQILRSESEKQFILRLEGAEAENFRNIIQMVLENDPSWNFEDRQTYQQVQQNAASGGGFADIFHGRYGGQVIALKRLRVFQGSPDRNKIHDMLCQEALTWKQFYHPFVLPFLGIDPYTYPGFFCMVSPWMTVGTILKHVEANGLSALEVDRLLLEVAQGVEYLHGLDCVHGDLRGINILIDDDWHPRIADFGLAAFVDATTVAHTTRHGSLRWMAPELHHPGSFGLRTFRRTCATDVYAFACVCLEVHAKAPPFSEIPNNPAVLLHVLNGTLPMRPAADSRNAVSDELWSLMKSCWSRKVSDRPTMTVVVDKIKATLDPEAQNAMQESLQLTLGGDNSSSSSTPPTPALSLPGERHTTITIPSECDEPYPFSFSSSDHDVRSVRSPNPDSEYSGYLGHLFYDDEPILSPGVTTIPPIQHNNLVGVSLAAPWHNTTRYPQQLFPSPALGSQFSHLYTLNEFGFEDFEAAPVQGPPMLRTIDIPLFNNDDSLVDHYMRTVLQIQYSLADQNVIGGIIFQSTLSSDVARDAVCLLSEVQRKSVSVDIADDIQKRYGRIRSRLLGDALLTPSSGDAIAALHVVFSFLFSGGFGEWLDFLQVSISFSKRILGQHPFGPKEALIRCSEEERFIIKTSMWFDVLASATRLQIPQFLNEYRHIFGRNAAYIDSPISLAPPRKELCMLSVMGCESHIVWAMAEICNLDHWKLVQLQHGQLRVLELVDRAKEIENHLLPGRASGATHHPSHHMISETFRASARIYLHTVISGSYPHCQEIQEGVQATVDILKSIPTSITGNVVPSVVPSVMFSIFIASCLTNNPTHRDYLLLCLSQGSYVNCRNVRGVVEQVWSERRDRPKEPVPWRETLQRAEIMLV